MDRVVSARMEKDLTGKELGGWQLAECIGSGKSALVFRATRGAQSGAVKVFDPEVVDKFGADAQRQRVAREGSLVGKHHANLIEILDSGEDSTSGLFFVVMTLFPGRNLAEALADVPYDRIHDIISQVASAAHFLEKEGLAHRDIKPENIGITDDFSQAVLLDLGVLRPVGFSSITDQHGQKIFVGTLQYSPPELLHREEQDSIDGWRAVSFYQLGGVLHDLLTRKPLFADDLTPYGHLVEVVSHQNVLIQAPGAPPELRMLAQDCLVKDPQRRLELVSWERFQKDLATPGDTNAVKERIAQRRRSRPPAEPRASIPGVLEKRAIGELRDLIERLLRDACKQSDLPPFIVQTDDSLLANVRLVFGPSRSHVITATFSVYVEGTVVDLAGDIVLLRAAALVTSDPVQLPQTAPTSSMVEIFHGVRADDVLSHRLTNLLLFALDATQDRCTQGRVNVTSEWLSIPRSG